MGSAPSKSHSEVAIAKGGDGGVPSRGATQKKPRRDSKLRVSAAREAAGDDDKNSDEFHNICMSVFENADRDNDGNLNRDEFFSGLHKLIFIFIFRLRYHHITVCGVVQAPSLIRDPCIHDSCIHESID